MAKQKRDNDYYLGLVERHHPTIYARYLAGEFKSAAAAILAAGVRQPPKAIHALKRAWVKADASERREFLDWLRASHGKRRPASVSSPTLSIATVDRRLTEDAKKRLKTLYRGEPFPNGLIMAAIGIGTNDTSLGTAIARNTRLSPAMITLLEAWLPAEEAHRKRP